MSPVVFDPAAFLADLQAAGCRVLLSTPGTCFAPGDEAPSYFIAPNRGYSAVMARWADALDGCPDHVERVGALLVEMGGRAG